MSDRLTIRWLTATKFCAPAVVVGINARDRWRFLRLEAGFPRRSGVFTVQAMSWLTDAGERGNLRRKSFVRFKCAAGGAYPPGRRGCPWRSAKGRPCTWEAGHAPMVIGFRNTRTGEMVPGARSVRPHSFEMTGRLPANAVVLVEPRRRNGRPA